RAASDREAARNMIAPLDFTHPWWLLLMPLASLPLWRSRRDMIGFSCLHWLPRDRIGQIAGWLWRACGVLAIGSAVAALAGPGRPETQVLRTGHGAEVLLLVDRSRTSAPCPVRSTWVSGRP